MQKIRERAVLEITNRKDESTKSVNINFKNLDELYDSYLQLSNPGPRPDQVGVKAFFNSKNGSKYEVIGAAIDGNVSEIKRLVQQGGKSPNEKMTEW